MQKTYRGMAPAEAAIMEAIRTIPNLIANFNSGNRLLVADTDHLIVSRNPFGTFGRLDNTTIVSVRHVIIQGEGSPGEADLVRLKDDLQKFLIAALGADAGDIRVELSFDCLKEKPKQIGRKRVISSKKNCADEDQIN